MNATLLNEVLAQQARNGAFTSLIDSADGTLRDDHNCCATALVALELFGHRDQLDSRASAAMDRALDFVEACATNLPPGGFTFYPEQLRAARLPVRLPADIDDSALAWLVLTIAGRRTHTQAASFLNACLAPQRLLWRAGDQPPWVGAGALPTWLSAPPLANPVDAVANTNVLALMACVGHDDDGPARLIDRVLAYGVVGASHLRRVSPYYAHPLELLYAVRRAVEHGCRILTGALDSLTRVSWADDDRRLRWPRRRPVFCNAHGRPHWLVPPLQAAREWSWQLRHGPCAVN